MPLTDLQRDVLALVSGNRTPDSYLAGAALHFMPNSTRFSDDLDFFNDSVNRVASAYADDHSTLVGAGLEVDVEISQPGFVRAIVRRAEEATRIDWAHDSAWRFMPPVRDDLGGFLLHDVDLAVNKTLALVAPFDLERAKMTWLGALTDADTFVRSRKAEELGCLYYSAHEQRFVMPQTDEERSQATVHHGRPGGVLPQPADRSIAHH